MNLIQPSFRHCVCSVSEKASWIMLGVVMLLGGCDGSGTTEAEMAGELRIVSLSPGFTRNLVDLGLGELIVGRTPYCHAVSSDTPVIGDLERIDFETLVRVRPTHLFVQPPRGGVDPELLRMVDEKGWKLYQRTVDDVADVVAMIVDVPEVLGVDEGLRNRAETLAGRLRGLVEQQEAAWSGRVLMLTTGTPQYGYGRRTYLSDMLEALGSKNVLEAEGWVRLSLEDITRLAPEGLIVVSWRPVAPDATPGPGAILSGLAIPANDRGNVGILAHPEVILPSSSLLEVHGELLRLVDSWASDEP